VCFFWKSEIVSYKNKLSSFTEIVESLDIEKKMAVAKWLEGVVFGQSLTPEEREKVVKAVNKYVCSLKEGEYGEGINALLDFLRELQTRKQD